MEEKKKFVLSEQEIREGIVPFIGEKDWSMQRVWLVYSYIPNHPEFDLHSHDDREALAKAFADEVIKLSAGKEEYAGLDDFTLREKLQTENWAMAIFGAYIDEKLSNEEKWGVYNKSCVCIAPYQDWGDGIKGCVLVRDWNTDNPMVFLVDNDVRTTGHERVFRNTFYPYETRIHYHYVEDCEQVNDGYALATREDYAKYHIVLLAGSLESCLIDDVACYGINMNEARQGNYFVFNVNRFQKRLANAMEKRKMTSGINELLEMENADDWRQQIVMEVLKQRGASEYTANLIQEGKRLAMEYLEPRLGRTAMEMACTGKRLIEGWLQKPEDYCWWDRLENMTEISGDLSEIVSNGCSIKEVLAFAAYAKHLKDTLNIEDEIKLASLSLEERMDIFDNYLTALRHIAMRDLIRENDPLRTSLPDGHEAKAVAISRAKIYLQKEPEWLPEEVRSLYADYERAFRKYCEPEEPKKDPTIDSLQSKTDSESPALVRYDMRKAMRYTMGMAEKWEKEAKETTKMAMDRWWKKIPEDLREKAIAQKLVDIKRALEASEFLKEYALELSAEEIDNIAICSESQEEADHLVWLSFLDDLYDGELHILNDEKLERHIYVFQNRLTEEQIFAFYDYEYEMDYLDKLKNVDNECDAAEQVVYDFISTEIYSYDAAIEKVKQVFGKSTAKAKKIRELYSLQNMKYVDINKYANDEKRAEVINQFVGKDQFTADDFVRARKPQKSQKSAVKKKE